MTRFGIPLLIALSIALVALSACGGDGDGDSGAISPNDVATAIASGTLEPGGSNDGDEPLPTNPLATPFGAERNKLLESLQPLELSSNHMDLTFARVAEGLAEERLPDADALEDDWLDACCPRQWADILDAIDDVDNETDDLEELYADAGFAAGTDALAALAAPATELRDVIDRMPAAATQDDALALATTGAGAAARLYDAVLALIACCSELP